jgi:hypothetical protein
MLLATDVTATFHPSTIPGSRSLGVGQLNVCGIVINFTVYPSQYGQGFLVSFPSRPVIKNGVHEVDQYGKKKYMNEVYIADQSVRPIVDDAVLQAMTNKGITVQQPTQQPQGNRGFAQSNPQSFAQQNTSFNNTPTGSEISLTASVISGDDLPF